MKIGLKVLSFSDPLRSNWEGTGARPMLTDIWYPARGDAPERDIFIGPPDAPLFKAGKAAPEAEFAADRACPLILLSHGTGGMARQHAWLAEVLCRQGYLVAGVNHHGNTVIEPYHLKGFLHVWERPRDISAVLDRLLDDPLFGPHIIRERIGAAGFSLGGYTVIALAGGVLDLKALQKAFHAPGRDISAEIPPEIPDKAAFMTQFDLLTERDMGSESSFRDERIKAVFAIAPALGEGFDGPGLAPVGIPVAIVAGAADTLAPPRYNAARYAQWIPRAKLEILPGAAAHYTFLAEGTALGRETLPHLCVDPPGADRRLIQQQVAEKAKSFFDEQLRGY